MFSPGLRCLRAQCPIQGVNTGEQSLGKVNSFIQLPLEALLFVRCQEHANITGDVNGNDGLILW